MTDPLPRRIGVLPGDAPTLATAPILAVGRRVLAVEREREAMQRQAQADMLAVRALSPGRGGDVEHATALQVAEAFGIVTDTDSATGATLCDCPRHNSDSKRSLHVNADGEQWYCFGCQKGGGAWALAAWCLGDDKATESAIVQALRAARQGEEVRP